jgi:uncharacterized NAD(P)/FAD-binding protein YdhS
MQDIRHPLVIIGDGFASFCLCAHLVRHAPIHSKAITVIGNQPFGFGAAYGCSHEDFRLNVRAQIMRIFPEDPNGFLHWAAENLTDAQAHNAQGSFYRRADFALYLSELTSQIEGLAQINFISDKAVQLNRSPHGWQITSQTGQQIHADKLVLATGNAPPKWPCEIIGELPEYRAVENPWSGAWLKTVDTQAHLVFIGGGLTAMDGLYSLARLGHKGPIQLISPYPMLPPEQTDWQEIAPIIWPENIQTASQFFRFFVSQLGGRDWTQTIWQSRFEALRIHLNTAWQALDDTAKKRLMRHVGHWWQLARFRSAPQAFQAAQNMLNTGQLKIIKGRVKSIQAQNKTAQLSLQDGQKIQADQIINCAGPTRDPLSARLIETGLAVADLTGRSVRVNSAGQVLDTHFQPMPNLWAVGAQTAGSLGDVIGAGSVAKQAAILARTLTAILPDKK